MVYTHTTFAPRSSDNIGSRRVRLFSTGDTNPTTVNATYRKNRYRGYLSLHGVIDTARQPFIHHADVTVRGVHTAKVHKFIIFFQRHRALPFNMAIDALTDKVWRGDVVVARVEAGQGDGVVHLRNGDDHLIDLVLERAVHLINFYPHLRYARHLDLDLPV